MTCSIQIPMESVQKPLWKVLVFLLLLNAVPTVQVATVVGETQPFFVEAVINVTVVVGRDASLTCVVENLEPYKVAWIHLDRQMIVTIHRHVVTRIPRFGVSHDGHRTWTLHIRGIQPEDAGRYMCQVNSEPMISQVGIVDVVVPPTILDTESSPSHITVREGNKVTLSCRGEGFPMPKVIWRREDSRFISTGPDRKKPSSTYESEDLTFHKVSRMDSGAYLCIASNGVPPSVSKRILVDVEFAPMVWVPNQIVGAPLNSSVLLECHTEAQPKPISYWVRSDGSRNDVILLPSRRIKSETLNTGYQNHMKLAISQLDPADFGTYKCVAKNSLGEAEGSMKLVEIAPPPTTQRRPPENYQDNELTRETGTTRTKSNVEGSFAGTTPSVHVWYRGKKQSEHTPTFSPRPTTVPSTHSGTHRIVFSSAWTCILITLAALINSTT